MPRKTYSDTELDFINLCMRTVFNDSNCSTKMIASIIGQSERTAERIMNGEHPSRITICNFLKAKPINPEFMIGHTLNTFPYVIKDTSSFYKYYYDTAPCHLTLPKPDSMIVTEKIKLIVENNANIQFSDSRDMAYMKAATTIMQFMMEEKQGLNIF